MTRLAIAGLVVFCLGSDANAQPSAWKSEVLLESGHAMGGAAIGDLDAESPGNEVAVVNATGEAWMVKRSSNRWVPERIHDGGGEMIMCAIGDVLPQYPGNEFVGVGMVQGQESLEGPGQVVVVRKSKGTWFAGRVFEDSHMVHGVAIGDISSRSQGNEIVVCGFNHRVTLLSHDKEQWRSEIIYVGNDRMKIALIADILPERDGLEVVVSGSDGNVVVLWEGSLGWKHEVIYSDSVGQSRVAWGSGGVLIGGDDGKVTIAHRHQDRWTAEFLTRDSGKIRGVAVGDVDDAVAGDEFYACGYSRNILQVTPGEQGILRATVIFEAEKPLHHLVAGELDSDHHGLELVTCGHGGRLLMLRNQPAASVREKTRGAMKKTLLIIAVTMGLRLFLSYDSGARGASDPKDDAPTAPKERQPPLVSADKPADYRGVHNVVTFAPGLLSGSVPEGDEGFDSLKAMGVRTIISVDGAAPAVELAAARGIRYIHLPIGYNGMDRQRTMEIARAIQVAQERDSNALVYVHCHHGKHRSAGALGGAVVTLGYATAEQAKARMKVSGTSPSYTGLYGCVAAAYPANVEELAAMPSEFPSVWKTSGLVKSMVEVDHIYDHLKLIEKAGWAAPKDHPDLVPASEAGRLADIYRHLLDDERVKGKPVEFRDWLLEASERAEALEAELASGGHAPDQLSKRFEGLTQSCKECHIKYRD